MPPEKKQKTKRKNPNTNFKPPNRIELAVAALLLTGKLKVDSVELFREASLIISLIGKYDTLTQPDSTSVDKLMNFLDQNGNTTMNDILNALRKKSTCT
jgi:hypothetical protein